MDHWKSKKFSEEAWEYLYTLNTDVALVQEAKLPVDDDTVVGQMIDQKDRPWGSGIVSPKLKLTEVTKAKSVHSRAEVDLLNTKPGCVAIARITLPDNSGLTLISCYGLIDDGYAQTTMYRIIADLIPLFDDKELGKRVILAGDLNITSQMKNKTERIRHQAILESIKSLGLLDCLEMTKSSREAMQDCPCPEAPDCGHVVTHRHNRGSQMHIDYIYATESLARKLENCYVIDERKEFPTEDSKWKLSDHCPVVAEFNL